MPKPTEPSEADIVFNRANVALAKHQRLVASWLSPPSAQELASAKSQDELQKEEEDMFAPVPELLGVGAVVPKDSDGLPKRSEASAMEKLRKQLLGKNAAAVKPVRNGSKAAVPEPAKASKSSSARTAAQDDESDEEGGRAIAITSSKSHPVRPKKNKKKRKLEQDEDSPETGADLAHQKESDSSAQAEVALEEPLPKATKKRAKNFLDEMLEKKSKKNKGST
ncbi:hypothetical protein BT63DRAFT_421308 [Microthyrium microscopicum]|uniref:Uncharacterized protein n=1 Tax=Microthyrium microscopicum TaxID=703497 RepID=A0A6A6ULL5_9PEZI|nr:hypothetical protein BT63DRAFT_421308 [Microthyrium microscopicum]